MKKLPTITTKIANETLQPYFNSVYDELRNLSGSQKKVQLQRYVSYLETEAQKSSIAVRIQIRINVASLLEKLGEAIPEYEQHEPTVRPRANAKKRPRFDDERYYEFSTDYLGLDTPI